LRFNRLPIIYDPILDFANLRPSLEHLTVEGVPVELDLPLIQKIYDLNADITLRFLKQKGDAGIGNMGLLLYDEWEPQGYWCTPANSLAFGHTGGDGAHFSFLLTSNRIDSSTPVIISVPDAYGEPADANFVMGRGFEDFLRFGLQCGFFSMANFAFDLDETLQHYSRTDWRLPEDWFPSPQHRVVAEYVAEKLRLTPLTYTKDEFERLQSEFRPLMQFRPE
jgi:hypothetical protein